MLGINKITISPELLRQIADIDEFKGLWTGLDRHTTGLQLLGDVADYGAKFETLLGPLKGQPISTDMIRMLHAVETKKKNPSSEINISEYKDESSTLLIKAGDDLAGILDTAEPQQVEPLLEKLCEWVNAELTPGNWLHPLIVIAVFAAVYLQISPFKDGNMRIVLFLIVVMLIKAEYVYAPYASLAPAVNNRGAMIFKALKANQESLESGRADWDEWLRCFMVLLQDQKDVLVKRLYVKEVELKKMPALSSRIMELFKEHRRLQMADIIRLTRGRRATIKLRLNELVGAGYLHRHGKGRGTWYSLV